MTVTLYLVMRLRAACSRDWLHCHISIHLSIPSQHLLCAWIKGQGCPVRSSPPSWASGGHISRIITLLERSFLNCFIPEAM